jgi:hypothetical protein
VLQYSDAAALLEKEAAAMRVEMVNFMMEQVV